jgi:tetratricopeptide (TPR) repeat protein
MLLGGLAGLAAAVSLAAPWLSGLMVDEAAGRWPSAPFAAYARLDDAARLNPLSDGPYLLAGSIAVRFRDFARADRYFARALARVPNDAYATLERGAIASRLGRRRLALALLGRAARLQPRNPLARAALRVARRRERVNVAALNGAILQQAQQLR